MAKIGEGHLAAFVRQGHKEIAQALQAFPDSMRTVEEPGLAGNLTQQEVLREKDGYQKQLGGYQREQQQGGMER
jgi:hypothetical protein